MKKYFLFMLLLCAGQLFSQSKLGIATYTVPFGWQTTSRGSVVVLESNSKKGDICRITIYSTEKAVVNTASQHVSYRNSKNGTNARFNGNEKQANRTETNGNIGFLSSGSATVSEKQVAVHFYSFTNGSETFFVEVVASSNECLEAFNQFLATLLIDAPASNSNLRRARKAAPAAPAAPAPMM